jgi:hypothetical protein
MAPEGRRPTRGSRLLTHRPLKYLENESQARAKENLFLVKRSEVARRADNRQPLCPRGEGMGNIRVAELPPVLTRRLVVVDGDPLELQVAVPVVNARLVDAVLLRDHLPELQAKRLPGDYYIDKTRGLLLADPFFFFLHLARPWPGFSAFGMPRLLRQAYAKLTCLRQIRELGS